jgi:hypothetical protein
MSLVCLAFLASLQIRAKASGPFCVISNIQLTTPYGYDRVTWTASPSVTSWNVSLRIWQINTFPAGSDDESSIWKGDEPVQDGNGSCEDATTDFDTYIKLCAYAGAGTGNARYCYVLRVYPQGGGSMIKAYSGIRYYWLPYYRP